MRSTGGKPRRRVRCVKTAASADIVNPTIGFA